MTPHDFLTTWRGAELKERSGSQSHFNDLCALLGLANPAAADPKGEWFTFEKGASKTGGGEGWADVWRRECFAWEYKGPGKDLDRALQQLLRYARSLENPPLLIVSDMTVIRVHTNFTNTVEEVHLFTLDDLLEGDKRERLKQAFIDPDAFRPAKTRAMLTEQVAREFATLAQRLRDRGHEATAVAHFVVRCAFCMFAEDVELLPNKMFERLVAESRRNPEEFVELAGDLFRLMRTGGRLGLERVAWFNGGLLDDDVALPLNRVDLDLLHDACKQHWAEIDPSILGTLFERGLDPGKRSQLGAHYTDRAKIELIVDPTIAGPLTAEWAGLRDRVTAEVEAAETAAAALRERAGVHGELKAEVRELEGALARGRQPDLFPDAPRRKLVRELDALAAEVRAATARVRAARAAVRAARDGFMAKLRAFRVLDPACGSGNFLYVALKLLKDIEHRVNVDAEALGVPVVTPEVGPANVLGIELNPFAAELARTSVWIGDIQWMRKNGFEPSRDPVLKPLTTIECRDAVLSELDPPQLAGEGDHAKHGGGAADPGERLVADAPPPLASGERSPSPSGGGSRRAAWPAADVIIGNPPFLGNKKMIAELGEDYTRALRATYPEVPGGVDLVCYWFAKAWAAIVAGRTQRSGLVSTQSIRRGTNRKVLQPVVDEGRIFYALSDEEWTVEGADVRVSLICFGRDRSGLSTLDRQSVARIGADLSSDGDGRRPNILQTNLHVAGQGTISGGPFEVPPSVARRMLAAPLNPNLQSNSAVVRPWRNGDDLTDRPADWWIIDFGSTLALDDAALFELPFAVLRDAWAEAQSRREEAGERLLRKGEAKSAARWWILQRRRNRLLTELQGQTRYLATPRVSKHRFFVWLEAQIVPDTRLVAFRREDDTFAGVLHSKLHELWSLRFGGRHGVGNDPEYLHTATFETFPFPEGLTPDIPAAAYAGDPRAQAIAAAAARLNELRENWLNPADLVVRKAEVVPGYPDRLLPRDEAAARLLNGRTLTNLYNARPAWLANAHAALDAAVAGAYGWGEEWRAGMSDDAVLARLFALNQARAGVGG